MNVPALMKTRNLLARSETYDQTKAGKSIGSFSGQPCCIAGHCVVAHGYVITGANLCEGPKGKQHSITIAAGRELGLSMKQSSIMFEGRPFAFHAATKDEALALLDRAIETDVIEWTVC